MPIKIPPPPFLNIHEMRRIGKTGGCHWGIFTRQPDGYWTNESGNSHPESAVTFKTSEELTTLDKIHLKPKGGTHRGDPYLYRYEPGGGKHPEGYYKVPAYVNWPPNWVVTVAEFVGTVVLLAVVLGVASWVYWWLV